MQRLGRWLFNLAAVVSTVLLILMALLWVRSYRSGDSMGWVRTNLPENYPFPKVPIFQDEGAIGTHWGILYAQRTYIWVRTFRGGGWYDSGAFWWEATHAAPGNFRTDDRKWLAFEALGFCIEAVSDVDETGGVYDRVLHLPLLPPWHQSFRWCGCEDGGVLAPCTDRTPAPAPIAATTFAPRRSGVRNAGWCRPFYCAH